MHRRRGVTALWTAVLWIRICNFSFFACLLIVWRSRPSQEEEGLVKCLYRARGRQPESGRPHKYVSVVGLRKLTTTCTDLPSEALTQARLTVLDSTPSCTWNVADFDHSVVANYIPLTQVPYRHLTRPSSSCEGRLRQTSLLNGLRVTNMG